MMTASLLVAYYDYFAYSALRDGQMLARGSERRACVQTHHEPRGANDRRKSSSFVAGVPPCILASRSETLLSLKSPNRPMLPLGLGIGLLNVNEPSAIVVRCETMNSCHR